MTTLSPTSTQKRRIRSSLRTWRGALEQRQAELFEAFVNQALNSLRGPFLAQHHPKEVLQYLEIAFQFTLNRGGDGPKVDIRTGQTKGVLTLVNLPDQPFIVDTTRLFLKDAQADYWGGFNLVFPAVRNDNGDLIDVSGDGTIMESLVLLESDTGLLPQPVEDAAPRLMNHLRLAQSLVLDFRTMTRTVERARERLEESAIRDPLQGDALRETAALLKWLLRENFVFMGLEILHQDQPISALGIQSTKNRFYGNHLGDWPAPHEPGTVYVRKSAVESPVHRSGRIDEILFKLPERHEFDALFIRGMFTYRAINQPCRNVPVLRRVLASILAAQEAKPGSFRHKGIANVFDSLPTEFLFTADQSAIQEMVDLVFESEQQQEVGVTFLMIGADSAFCLIAMPKAQFSDEMRIDLQEELIDSTSASYIDHGIFVGRYDTVLLHYYLTGIQAQTEASLTQLSERIRVRATPWFARLWFQLAEKFDEDTADRLAETYGNAFPQAWIRANSAERTVEDIVSLEGLSGKRHPTNAFFLESDGTMVLRLYQPTDVYLSTILPILDDFGLIIIDSYATIVSSRGGIMTIDTFRVAGAEGVPEEELISKASVLTDAIDSVFALKVASDPLNRLTVAAGLTWEEVDAVRAYIHYIRQILVVVTPSRTREIVLSRPIIVSKLIGLFKARFSPALDTGRDETIRQAEDAAEIEIRRILAHDEHLVFSTLYYLIQHTLRTNFYRSDRLFHYLSFKLDVQRLSELEGARHLYEVYVHHKDVEGIHIRFGPVSRGGLRWSDRNDYRSEVLGLATTQQKKNVVIVPEGSKGAFYLKNPNPNRSERRQEADHHYQTFIRGLLDITDNAINGQATRPPQVVCHDSLDPYLVVAADKGTAHLSDTANRLSLEYNYWLGDALASGGSNGYDHKAVGITARGAWVLAKRHFAEMARDPYAEPFTCVGIGDCGGDVYGNGMTETPHLRLLAAFNHMHVFIDPDPDPESSFKERLRLFKSGRQGGWGHYDTRVISKGGGVFDRTAKTIPLSIQAQEMLGLDKSDVDPEIVIHHILKMEVDLLWNGGIGTYVKASFESHADADDRANDQVRVSANELRCRIVGEGGNLGFTQCARVEADQHGVRLNTDAIDNSAGVDMSDHEVNIKILLDRVVERMEITPDERNALLESMTEEVAFLVMANNDAHGRQISRDVIRSQQDIFQFGRAIAFVEREFDVQRRSLNLPEHPELLRRSEAGEGLTRPELAVLGAWVKMHVYTELLKGKPKRIEGYKAMLRTYFPKALQKEYADDIKGHMLANEIAMTCATTRVVADAGAAFVPIMIETTGATVEEIVTALFKAQKLARVSQVRSTLEELRATVALNTLNRAWVQVVEGARMVALYWLSARGRVPTDKELNSMVAAVDRVYELQSSSVQARNKDRLAELLKDQIPQKIATHVLKAEYLNLALMVWSESRRTDVDLKSTIVRNVAIGRASGLLQIIEELSHRAASGQWEPIALQILYIRYLQLLRSVVARVEITDSSKTVDELQPTLETGALKDVRRQVQDLLRGEEEAPSTATLLVLEERLASALTRMDPIE